MGRHARRSYLARPATVDARPDATPCVVTPASVDITDERDPVHALAAARVDPTVPAPGFPRTYEQIFADRLDLEYVETEAGDVYAWALVSPATGEILSVTDDDGVELSAWPIEACRRVLRTREERRAAA